MNQTLTNQPISAIHNSESKRRKLIMTSILWAVQGLLALLFLFSGAMKLIMPIEMLLAQMTVPLPGLLVKFIGVAEVAGGLGLLLPGLFRIQRVLTPLAACGLIIIMIGATVVTLLGGEGASALFPLVVGLLCAAIAYGRRSWKTA